MSRIVLTRSLAALTLVLGLCLFSPVWATGTSHPRPAAPAPAAASRADAGAVKTQRSWLEVLLAKLGIGSAGKPIAIEGGICIDPNGGCT
jgi:hypothetical protein